MCKDISMCVENVSMRKKTFLCVQRRFYVCKDVSMCVKAIVSV